MMTDLAVGRTAAAPALRRSGHLLVTVRRPSGSYEATGILTLDQEDYEFAYLESAVAREDFVTLFGFDDVKRRYRRPYLFPLFAERVLSASRPDRAEYLSALDLRQDATPFEVLARSGGQRPGDAIELTPFPQVSDSGRLLLHFLVHGIRYRGQEASEEIEKLARGDMLQLTPEPNNEKDPRAIQVRSMRGTHLGYVPAPLLDVVHPMLNADQQLTVAVANGQEVAFHLRLLARLEGGDLDASVPLDPPWTTLA